MEFGENKGNQTFLKSKLYFVFALKYTQSIIHKCWYSIKCIQNTTKCFTLRSDNNNGWAKLCNIQPAIGNIEVGKREKHCLCLREYLVCPTFIFYYIFLFLNNSQIKINQIPLQTMHMIILLAQPPLSKITWHPEEKTIRCKVHTLLNSYFSHLVVLLL